MRDSTCRNWFWIGHSTVSDKRSLGRVLFLIVEDGISVVFTFSVAQKGIDRNVLAVADLFDDFFQTLGVVKSIGVEAGLTRKLQIP